MAYLDTLREKMSLPACEALIDGLSHRLLHRSLIDGDPTLYPPFTDSARPSWAGSMQQSQSGMFECFFHGFSSFFSRSMASERQIR